MQTFPPLKSPLCLPARLQGSGFPCSAPFLQHTVLFGAAAASEDLTVIFATWNIRGKQFKQTAFQLYIYKITNTR